jgi:hypothetical protein
MLGQKSYWQLSREYTSTHKNTNEKWYPCAISYLGKEEDVRKVRISIIPENDAVLDGFSEVLKEGTLQVSGGAGDFVQLFIVSRGVV